MTTGQRVASLLLLWTAVVNPEPVVLEVGAEPSFRERPRLGVNLGDWSSWGASQYGRNLLRNPGFEATEDRALVVVTTADGRGFSDDTSWTGRPDGFWAGGQFVVRSGASVGKGGKLFDSRQKGRNGLPEFLTEGIAPPLIPGDVVMVRRTADPELLPAYWQSDGDALPGQIKWMADTRRPEGVGERVVELQSLGPRPARLHYWLDALGDRAGKLIRFQGRWRLSLWVNALVPESRLKLRFGRDGQRPFLEAELPLQAGWQSVEREFEASDDGPPAAAQVTIEIGSGRVQLDDIELAAVAEGDAPFRNAMVETLGRLRPGYLRDWQGQLGDGFDNRIASPFARRPSRYRPGQEERYLYGLADFLTLCQQVGANPWIILPTTLMDEEYRDLGRWLAEWQQRQPFTEMVVEFGNENWNTLFRPAGLPSAAQLGAVANRAFEWVSQGAGDAPLRFVIGGQHVNPDGALQSLDAVPRAGILAVAPYLLHQLERKDFDESPWPLLFRRDNWLPREAAGVSRRGKSLAVYEVNLHTTRSDLPAERLESVVAGAASGPAVAQRLLEALALGVERQCLYTLAQYDTALADNHGFVKLWGITRDLGVTARLRPSGLGMALLNRWLPADIHPVRSSGQGADALFAIGLHGARGWQLALVSGAAEPLSIEARFPPGTARPDRLWLLDGSQPELSNENSEQVRIREAPLPSGKTIRVEIPPWSLMVLGQEERPAPPVEPRLETKKNASGSPTGE